MKSLLTRLSLAALFLFTLVGCGNVPPDDTKLNDLEEDEQVALCEDICADAVSYDLSCMEDGSEINSSSSIGDDEGTCNTGCAAQLAKIEDSCALSVGDLRDVYTVEPTCETIEARFATAIALATCTGEI